MMLEAYPLCRIVYALFRKSLDQTESVKIMTTKYSTERKEAIINKNALPSSMSVAELAKQEKIPYGTPIHLEAASYS